MGRRILRDTRGIIWIGRDISKKSANIHTKRKKKEYTRRIEISSFFFKVDIKSIAH